MTFKVLGFEGFPGEGFKASGRLGAYSIQGVYSLGNLRNLHHPPLPLTQNRPHMKLNWDIVWLRGRGVGRTL